MENPTAAFDLKITTPWRVHLGIALGCGFGMAVGGLRWVTNDQPLDWTEDGWVLMGLLVVGVYFAYRARTPKLRLRINKAGIWTEQAGLQPWQQVDELLVEKRPGYKGTTVYWLVLHWNEEVDLPAHQLLEEYRFDDLSISRKAFETRMRPILAAFREM